MHHALSIDELQHLTRSRVCDACPYRTAGTHGRPIDQSKPCEAVCPLFQRLPVLRQAARQIDITAGTPPQALHRVLERIAHRAPKRAKIVKRHEPTVIAMLQETFT
jgi:hypothetical protein